jgi:STE24 endopeptidase
MTTLPIPSADALHWHAMSNLFWSTDELIGVVWAVIVLASGAGASTVEALTARLRRPWLATGIFFAGYLSVDRALHVVVNLAWDRAHARAFGHAVPSLAEDVSGRLVGWFVGVVGCVVVALAVRALATRAPRQGWLVAGAAMTSIAMAVLVGQPAFERGVPLGDGPTGRAIAEVARHAGVPIAWLMAQPCAAADACDPAHVVGVGPTRRVIIDTTQMEAMPLDWARQTMAHESHHALEDDNARALPVIAAVAFLAAWLALRGADMIARWQAPRLGFDRVTAPAALPLVLAVLTLAWVLLQPPLNIWRQHVELEADRFALRLTGDGQAQAAMLAHFADQPGRLPEPSRFYQLFRDGHPSDAERIRLADAYAGASHR